MNYVLVFRPEVREELDEAKYQYIIHCRFLSEALISSHVNTLSGFAS